MWGRAFDRMHVEEGIKGEKNPSQFDQGLCCCGCIVACSGFPGCEGTPPNRFTTSPTETHSSSSHEFRASQMTGSKRSASGQFPISGERDLYHTLPQASTCPDCFSFLPSCRRSKKEWSRRAAEAREHKTSQHVASAAAPWQVIDTI